MFIDFFNKIYIKLIKFVCFNYGEFLEIFINRLKCYICIENKLYSIDNFFYVYIIVIYFVNGKCNVLSFEYFG